MKQTEKRGNKEIENYRKIKNKVNKWLKKTVFASQKKTINAKNKKIS